MKLEMPPPLVVTHNHGHHRPTTMPHLHSHDTPFTETRPICYVEDAADKLKFSIIVNEPVGQYLFQTLLVTQYRVVKVIFVTGTGAPLFSTRFAWINFIKQIVKIINVKYVNDIEKKENYFQNKLNSKSLRNINDNSGNNASIFAQNLQSSPEHYLSLIVFILFQKYAFGLFLRKLSTTEHERIFLQFSIVAAVALVFVICVIAYLGYISGLTMSFLALLGSDTAVVIVKSVSEHQLRGTYWFMTLCGILLCFYRVSDANLFAVVYTVKQSVESMDMALGIWNSAWRRIWRWILSWCF